MEIIGTLGLHRGLSATVDAGFESDCRVRTLATVCIPEAHSNDDYQPIPSEPSGVQEYIR